MKVHVFHKFFITIEASALASTLKPIQVYTIITPAEKKHLAVLQNYVQQLARSQCITP